MQLPNVTNAMSSAAGYVVSGAKTIGNLGARGVSYGFQGAKDVSYYIWSFSKDTAKSATSFCNNNARTIGIAGAGVAALALIVYCAKKFFRPATTSNTEKDKNTKEKDKNTKSKKTSPEDTTTTSRAAARAARAAKTAKA